jgi:signal transduction histidine kinase
MMPRPLRPDALTALAVGGALQAEIWLFEGGPRGVEPVTVAGALLFAASVAWRRAAPRFMAGLAAVTFAVSALLGGELTTTLSMVFAAMLVSFSIGLHLPDPRSVIAAAGFLAATWIDIVAAPDAEYEPASDIAFTGVIVVAGPWFAGRALRGWRERAGELEALTESLREEREHRARAAVLDERARIAREMHDVVAHSVSLMVVQAGGARRMLDEDPEESRAALESIETAGRLALQELRRSLGMLRSESAEPAALAPQPGTAQIAELVERTRASGLPVELRVEGVARPVPPGIDLAAYRIVQEALTNAVKHAGPARASVGLRWSAEALELSVTDDGRPENGAAEAGGGHGLIGMRERVAAYGGTFSAGAGVGGGYEMRARIPLGEPQP